MTSNRNAKIIAAVESGRTYTEVAADYGISRSGVSGIVWRHRNPGASVNYIRTLRRHGDTVAALAAKDAALAMSGCSKRAWAVYSDTMRKTGLQRLAEAARRHRP